MKKYAIPATFVILAAVIVGGFALFELRSKTGREGDGEDGRVNIGGIIVDENDAGNVHVEIVPDNEAIARIAPPSLDGPIAIPSRYPREFRVLMAERIATVIAELKKDPVADSPEKYNNWLNLAAYYHEIENYRGAEAIWLYLDEIYPNSQSVTSSNLASLYHLYLKDFEKSERYYLRAIEIEPSTASHYIGLHELYLYSYKQGTNAAEDILKRGLAAIKQSTDLLIRLASYYKDIGRVWDAVLRYEEALAIAKKSGNNSLASAIENDLTSLK